MRAPRGLHRDRRGGIALLVALTLLPLIGLCGLAVDAGRGWLLRSRLTSAVDAAALAGGGNITTMTAAQRDAMIRGIFWANFGYRGVDPEDISGASRLGFMGASARDPGIVAPEAGTIEVTAQATIPATFLRLLGQTDITTTATAAASGSTAGMELALVLDVTGSMLTNNNYKALRTAAGNLVDIVFGNKETQPNLWVSVVPYVTTVNFGADREKWLVNGSVKKLTYPKGYGWRGCVEARWQDGYDLNDAPPSERPFQPFYWASTSGVYKKNGVVVAGDNDWIEGNVTEGQQDSLGANWQMARGPNIGCPLVQVLPLSSSRTAVKDTINRTFPTFGGGTMSTLGVQAGWFTISPRWQKLWDKSNLPLPYGTSGMRKVLVLFTDGENNPYDWPDALPGTLPGAPGSVRSTSQDSVPAYDGQTVDGDYSGYGRPNWNRLGIQMPALPSNPNNGQVRNAWGLVSDRITDEINRRMALLCANIKASGITVYTITFGNLDATARSLYQGCATSTAHYFNAPTQAALQQAFQQIGTQLSSLRLSR